MSRESDYLEAIEPTRRLAREVARALNGRGVVASRFDLRADDQVVSSERGWLIIIDPYDEDQEYQLLDFLILSTVGQLIPVDQSSHIGSPGGSPDLHVGVYNGPVDQRIIDSLVALESESKSDAQRKLATLEKTVSWRTSPPPATPPPVEPEGLWAEAQRVKRAREFSEKASRAQHETASNQAAARELSAVREFVDAMKKLSVSPVAFPILYYRTNADIELSGYVTSRDLRIWGWTVYAFNLVNGPKGNIVVTPEFEVWNTTQDADRKMGFFKEKTTVHMSALVYPVGRLPDSYEPYGDSRLGPVLYDALSATLQTHL